MRRRSRGASGGHRSRGSGAAARTRHNAATMDRKRNIFLVGMMASGKSTIGRRLAALRGLAFEDTDELVERRAGADIAWIFDMEGESGFRKREHAALADATAGSGIVLATGGGVVLREDNRDLLRQRGTVVYLEAAADVILERAGRDRRRPLLDVANVAEQVKTLLRERAPLYESVAHLTVATDRRPAREIAARVSQLLAESPAVRAQ